MPDVIVFEAGGLVIAEVLLVVRLVSVGCTVELGCSTTVSGCGVVGELADCSIVASGTAHGTVGGFSNCVVGGRSVMGTGREPGTNAKGVTLEGRLIGVGTAKCEDSVWLIFRGCWRSSGTLVASIGVSFVWCSAKIL